MHQRSELRPSLIKLAGGREEERERGEEGRPKEAEPKRKEGRKKGRKERRNETGWEEDRMKPSNASPPLPANVRLHWSSAVASQNIPQKGVWSSWNRTNKTNKTKMPTTASLPRQGQGYLIGADPAGSVVPCLRGARGSNAPPPLGAYPPHKGKQPLATPVANCCLL